MLMVCISPLFVELSGTSMIIWQLCMRGRGLHSVVIKVKWTRVPRWGWLSTGITVGTLYVVCIELLGIDMRQLYTETAMTNLSVYLDGLTPINTTMQYFQHSRDMVNLKTCMPTGGQMNSTPPPSIPNSEHHPNFCLFVSKHCLKLSERMLRFINMQGRSILQTYSTSLRPFGLGV